MNLRYNPPPPSTLAPISSQLYHTLGHIKTLAESTHRTLPSLLLVRVKFEPKSSLSHKSSSSQVKKFWFHFSKFLMIVSLAFIMLCQRLGEVFSLSSDCKSSLVATNWTRLTPFFAYLCRLLIFLKGFDHFCRWPKFKEPTNCWKPNVVLSFWLTILMAQKL